MKKTLSVVLTLAMLLSMMAVLFVTEASAATIISNTSPAITVDVDESIDLSNYSVVFDGETAATADIVWKNGEDTITTFTPDEKGVTALTATSGDKSKTIYVVAKNANETEYVLYEANMADFEDVHAMLDAGWVMPSAGTSYYTKDSDGSLSMGVTGGYDMVYAYLPEWLADFGDFGFTSEVKITSLVGSDTSRWLSLVYRSDTNAGEGHYYQMAVRDAASNGGVEFAERISGNWNVTTKGSASVTSLRNAYNKLNIQVISDDAAYYVNDKQVIYASDFKGSVKEYSSKGYIGLSMCGGTFSVKNVKITVQKSTPVEVIDTKLIFNDNHNADNLLNPIANVQKVSEVTASSLEGLSVAYFNAADVDIASAIETCIEAGVVPTIYIESESQAMALYRAINGATKKDATAISDDVAALKMVRSNAPTIRTGLIIDISEQMADGVLTAEEANEIRITVRNAPATFCVIDSKYATRDTIEELQQLALGVWIMPESTSSDGKEFDKEVMTILTAGVNGIVTDSASAVDNIVNTYFAENAVTRTPILIGHRGNPSFAPENTIESFQAAYETGADVFELDADVTKDKVAVILHDGSLTRTTTYEGSLLVSQMTWEEVQQYDVIGLDGKPTGKPIPTLEEVLEWMRDKDIKVFIEFKSADMTCIKQTMDKIKELDIAHKVDIISFDSAALTRAQYYLPGISTGYLLGNTISATSYGKALQQIQDLINYAQNVKSTVNPQSYGGEFTVHSVQALTDRGMTVWPWTYNTATTDKAFFSFADGVTTDNTDALQHVVKNLYAEDTTLVVGQTYIGGTLVAEEYGNDVYYAEPANIVPSIIDGDAVKVENGKLVAVKEGSATVVLGYRSYTLAGSEFIIYSQPITITVKSGDNKAAASLVNAANVASPKEYSEEALEELRALQAKAKDIANGAAATDAEICDIAEKITAILNNKYQLIPIPAVSYTAPAPNYDNPTYTDDGIRLIDGKAGNPNGGSDFYSAWGSGITVDIVVDYGEAINVTTFRGYFASGTWGISAPKDMQIYYSNDKSDWTLVEGTLDKALVIDSASWDVNEYTFYADKAVNARYIKFTITPTANFIWVDEVEASYQVGDFVKGEYTEIDGINSKIDGKKTNIFTPDFGKITDATAGNGKNVNLVAKWYESENAYIVTKVITDGRDITLSDGQILISGADLADVEVGQKIEFYGVDVENGELFAAPYVRFVESDVVVDPDDDDGDTSEDPGDTSEDPGNTSDPEDPGKEDDDYVLGDVNKNGGIDMTDYILVKRAYFGTIKFDEDQIKRGDCNQNGGIDMTDYIMLKRAYFGTLTLTKK